MILIKFLHLSQVAKLLGYSNEINPFGDSHLLQPFVWGKRSEKLKVKGQSVEEENPEEKRLKLMDEINKVRKRREDREAEMEEMDRLRSEEQRLREASLYGDWQQKEEDFHMEQTKVRSRIRLNDKREQPIELLAKNILLIDTSTSSAEEKAAGSVLDVDVELRDPLSLIAGLGLEQMERLVEDVSVYHQLSKKSKDNCQQFWESMTTITTASRNSLRRQSSSTIHKSLLGEVEELLRGKNEQELDHLERDIMEGIKDGRYSDVSYWEDVAKEVALQRAKTYVTLFHRQLLQKQLDLLGQLRQDVRHTRNAAAAASAATTADDASSASVSASVGGTGDEETFLRTEQQRGMEELEEQMRGQDEISLPGETYWWQDRYRPRKPRYFNRVRTGWDWNKYNQTHYDHDTPPPKTIHGYKFAVFYPDLIDKSVTPQYHLEPCDEKEFVILRFHAGPPYEDVAFKILNKEWDTHRKSGFRCVFERGLLQLHFNFKRMFYRR